MQQEVLGGFSRRRSGDIGAKSQKIKESQSQGVRPGKNLPESGGTKALTRGGGGALDLLRGTENG